MGNVSEVCQSVMRTCLGSLTSKPKSILCPINNEKCDDKELKAYQFQYSFKSKGWEQLINGSSVIIKRYKVPQVRERPLDIREDKNPQLPSLSPLPSKGENYCEKEIC